MELLGQLIAGELNGATAVLVLVLVIAVGALWRALQSERAAHTATIEKSLTNAIESKAAIEKVAYQLKDAMDYIRARD